MDIKVISLLSGENIIGVVDYNMDSKRYLIRDAQVVIMQHNPQTQAVGLSLMPWPPLMDHKKLKHAEHWINENVVVTVYEPNAELLGGYNSVTSGLIVPRKPVLLKE